MNKQKEFLTPERSLAQPAVQHAEPQMGGSFTRDTRTGALVANTPAPADQPEQE